MRLRNYWGLGTVVCGTLKRNSASVDEFPSMMTSSVRYDGKLSICEVCDCNLSNRLEKILLLASSQISWNVKWHSDPWQTVTSQPIRLSTNFMALIPSLTFAESWIISREHLQRVWHASRERLPFRTPCSVPRFGTCLCSKLLRPDSSNFPCLYSTFHLEYPLVLSRFCLELLLDVEILSHLYCSREI